MTRARDIADGLGAESGEVVPHIKLDILYPAVAGKLLDGSTSHSGDYGTAQSDGRSYYFTSIKGSKPIKDMRIGAYFGSQRHMFKSLQLLLDESSTHGEKIYSIDGREWIRAVDSAGTWVVQNNSAGNYLEASGGDCTGNFIEITGYFNDINFSLYTHTNRCDDIDISVNGTLSVDGSTTLGGKTIIESPLSGGFETASSFINGGDTLRTSLGTTPKINTIRYEAKSGSSEYISITGIELIAQDTTSTANKSKIQIPAQTVISYGKKHSISATAEHYDPFNGFVDDTTLFSAKVDTATSLGLGTATTWGAAWDTGSDDHIRPFNGGRCVMWVDSTGTIKRSVTMMPRNAQNIKTLASNEITNVDSTNAHIVNFSDDATDASLSEIAKRFHIREFGNGSANGGTGGNYADISMANPTQGYRAWAMSDGCTSFGGNLVKESYGYATYIQTDNGYWSLSFIGTGVAIHTKGYPTATGAVKDYIIAQNLPYGTHILKCTRDGDATPDWILDGVALDDVGGATYGEVNEITIFEPKKPPIPKDAVIITDYCLYADVVAPTAASQYAPTKGTRLLSGIRDMLHVRGSGSWGKAYGPEYMGTWHIYFANHADDTASVPSFCTGVTVRATNMNSQYKTLDIGSSTGVTTTKTWDGESSPLWNSSAVTLGNQKVNYRGTTASSTNHFSAFELWTPIRSSSYKMFESPFLKELIGGDRNMEQDELIVTPDGKTWSDVTRDTSYIGSVIMTANIDQNSTDGDYWWIMDNFRGDWSAHGNTNKGGGLGNKDFAIAYDRFICLKDGQYKIEVRSYNSSAGKSNRIYVNGTEVSQGVMSGGDHGYYNMLNTRLNRGDYIQVRGEVYSNTNYKNFNVFNITKL